MAVLTAEGIANVAIPLLTRSLVLPRTVTMVPATGFTGPNGETLTVRVRQPRTARTQAAAGNTITYDDQNEIPVTVSLSHLYDAYHITDEAMSYELEDFAEQITAPQVASVASGAEQTLYAAMNAIAADIELALTPTAADTRDIVEQARETMSANFIPPTDRWLAAAPDVITKLLQVDTFVRADALGDGRSSALRDAVVGRVLGFNVVEAPGLTAGTATAYHSSGFVFASKQPASPRGAVSTAAISRDGINIRQIFQYDPDVLSDASVLSTFAGAAAVYEDGTGSNGTNNDRFVKIGTSLT